MNYDILEIFSKFFLDYDEPNIVIQILDAFNNILDRAPNADAYELYKKKMEETNAVSMITNYQMNNNQDIYDKCENLIDTYFCDK